MTKDDANVNSYRVTDEDIEAARTEKGGWTKEVLATWGVPWPPPKGWRQTLLANGVPYEFGPRKSGA